MIIEVTPDDDATGVSGRGARRLYWNPRAAALLPGTAARPEAVNPGAGNLRSLWAVLPAAATPEIIVNARGLGLNIALNANAATPPASLAKADLAFFSDRLALIAARRHVPKPISRKLRLGPATALPGRPAAPPGNAPTRLYYWVSLTVTQPFNTGVQRVVRLLAVALQQRGVEVIPVKWDEADGRMAPLSAEDAAHLALWNGPVTTPRPLPDLAGAWLLLPEICLPLRPAGSDQATLGHGLGMRVAGIFHDLIPAKMAQNYPPEVQTLFRPYWEMFGAVDLALPNSWTVTADLARYRHARNLPQARTIPCPLAGEFLNIPRATVPRTLAPEAPLRLLAVGTWEPRKNYPRLLRALTAARAQTARPLRLTIVGRSAGMPELEAEIRDLAAPAGATLHDHVPDETLLALYATTDATVFASFEEGFGLPLLESLWHGCPCLCHDGSAMAETAPGGGALAVDMLDEAAITAGLLRLADEPGLLENLAAAAISRPIRSWDDYAADILQAMATAG